MKKEAPDTASTPRHGNKGIENVAKKQVIISIVSMLILFYIQIAIL